MSQFSKTTGANLRAIREKYKCKSTLYDKKIHMTMLQMSQAIGITVNQYRNYETGDANMSLVRAQQCCNLLGCKLSDLVKNAFI